MVTGRVHRMTELFGRLAPGATWSRRARNCVTVHAHMVKDHPDAYSAKAKFGIEAGLLRDQITSRARTVLLVLLAASALVFIIACSNVANLILARTRAARRGTGDARGAGRFDRRAAADAAGGKFAAMRRGSVAGRADRAPDGERYWPVTRRASRCARSI